MDFSNWKRPDWLISQKLKLLSASYYGKTVNRFSNSEPILLEMKWENLYDITNLCLRIEILSVESSPLATYVVYDLYSGKKGEQAHTMLELNTTMLVDATYKMRYTFFYRDNAGNNVNIDFVRGMCFKKVSLDSENAIVWDERQWGYIHMPEPIVRISD